MRYHSYLNTAKKIIETYTGATPLAVFLKPFFARDKKYGSRDRRQIATICYHYFRLGMWAREIDIESRICIATFLCEQTSNDFLQAIKPEWNEKIKETLHQKTILCGFNAENIFPWKEEFSEGIDHLQYCESFLQQPDLFLRIRPRKKNTVLKKIQDAGLNYTLQEADCIAFPNSSKLDGILELDKEAVVQDFNSQKVLDYLKQEKENMQHPITRVWDCCAASGGKSILAFDILEGKIQLTVSDIRESILANLNKRFARAGISGYRSFIADLNDKGLQLPNPSLPTGKSGFQLIICDAPCTGSGTWSRTPEQLHFFDPASISGFANRQKKIVSTALPHLQTGGLFFYITCSVFRKENEEITEFIKKEFHLQLVQVEILKGFDKRADTMFVALFKK